MCRDFFLALPNVSAYFPDNSIETVLPEGSEALHKSKAFGLSKPTVVLTTSQRGSYIKQNEDLNIYNEPDEFYFAWTNGWMQFSKESLHSVFTRLERHYDVQKIFSTNFPLKELISGKLDLKK